MKYNLDLTYLLGAFSNCLYLFILGRVNYNTNRELGLGPRPCAICAVVWGMTEAQCERGLGLYYLPPHSIPSVLPAPILSLDPGRGMRSHSSRVFICRVC